jgi:hypothetical protein
MAKTLKEALLEKFADLQELGIAPTTAPPLEDEGPAVVVEMGSDNYGEGGGRRQRVNRGGMYDDDHRGGDVPIRPRGGRGGGQGGRGGRGGERGGGERGRGGAGERFRRPDRGGERAALEGLPPPLPGGPGPRPPFGDRPGGPRPPFGDRPSGLRPPFGDRPSGPRPPFGDRGPRPGGPGGPPMGDRGPRPGGPSQMSTDARLQQNAERRRREAGQRDALLALLATHTGAEATNEVFDKFLADLTVETGALPELGRVVEAVKLADSIEPAKVGNAVRQLFRRGRTRPAGPPSGGPGGPPARRVAPAPAVPAQDTPTAPTPDAVTETSAEPDEAVPAPSATPS